MNQPGEPLTPPLRPMTARPAVALPDGERAGGFAFEPKFDGWRCVAFRTTEGVFLQSRQQRSLGRYFPEITAGLIEQVRAGTVLDGELVVHRGGRLDFGELQRRVHPSAVHAARRGAVTPATLVVFDVLALGGEDLRGRPYWARREYLEQLLRGVGAPLALMPVTRDLAGAQAWMSQHTAAGIEGVVVKDLRRAYRAGRAGWEKVRTRTTAEAVIGGVLGPLQAPQVLLLGLPGRDGRLRVAGRTGPLLARARDELGAVLVSPRGRHPWSERISSSRFGQLPGAPMDYTRAEPLVVVEVDADVCWEQDRWRHATTFRRLRPDLRAGDLRGPA